MISGEKQLVRKGRLVRLRAHISSHVSPENRSMGSVRVLGQGSEIDVIWLESIFSLGDGSHNL